MSYLCFVCLDVYFDIDITKTPCICNFTAFSVIFKQVLFLRNKKKIGLKFTK